MKIFNDKKFIRMEVIRLAQRGRKPKPTAVKQLEGNPGKRQLNANEPKPAARAPSCPKWLEDDAKKEWRRLAKQMEQLGILTEVDMAAFAGYCQAYARWKEAEEFINKNSIKKRNIISKRRIIEDNISLINNDKVHIPAWI